MAKLQITMQTASPSYELSQFGWVMLYLFGAAIFVIFGMVVSRLIAPRHLTPAKLSTYECGEEPFGDASVQFNMRFYVIGLIFLLFDVELLFLFPWITVFADVKLAATVPAWQGVALAEMLVFVGLLAVGLGYAWASGDIDWAKPAPTPPQRVNPVPDELYAAWNATRK